MRIANRTSSSQSRFDSGTDEVPMPRNRALRGSPPTQLVQMEHNQPISNVRHTLHKHDPMNDHNAVSAKVRALLERASFGHALLLDPLRCMTDVSFAQERARSERAKSTVRLKEKQQRIAAFNRDLHQRVSQSARRKHVEQEAWQENLKNHEEQIWSTLDRIQLLEDESPNGASECARVRTCR